MSTKPKVTRKKSQAENHGLRTKDDLFVAAFHQGRCFGTKDDKQALRMTLKEATNIAGFFPGLFAVVRFDATRTTTVREGTARGATWAMGFRAGEDQAVETLGEAGYHDAARYLRGRLRRERRKESAA